MQYLCDMKKHLKAVVLKLCVTTPRCVVSIFQRRRGIVWFCAIKSRFYYVIRSLIIVDFFLAFFFWPYLYSIHLLAWELPFTGHLSSTLRWGVPLDALPKDTTSQLAGLFSTTSHKCRAPSRKAIDTIF